MLQVIYYIIITVFALLLLLEIVKKRPFTELVCISFVLVTFALRALPLPTYASRLPNFSSTN